MSLPTEILASVGIHPSDIQKTIILRQKPEHTVYRLIGSARSYVLKWFTAPTKTELQTYTLLENLGIPTLPAHARTDQVLLLEDLGSSRHWRLATDLDMEQTTTGQAVAEWYCHLHQAGRKFLAEHIAWPSFLKPWVDVITPENLAMAAERFGWGQSTPGWRSVLANLPVLLNRYRALPQTLNYSDFAAENLALSCDEPRQAIVFDYDCFSIGTAYSDWRNVTYSLQGAARQAFTDAYGPVDPEEKQLDSPLATLEGLVIAAQRASTPAWALPLLKSVESGELQSEINFALHSVGVAQD
jgi:hypothetical protein